MILVALGKDVKYLKAKIYNLYASLDITTLKVKLESDRRFRGGYFFRYRRDDGGFRHP